MKLRYLPTEDLITIAYMNMLNNTSISTYTIDNGVEQRSLINPELAARKTRFSSFD